ncbi:hypothetical protein V6N11_025625 [Hibiscus sabdariffa]|uniref:Uncharacterized protein n=1 Tax=Hibiscus sabdariffa TaxID=183260 RepID=A0ABR2ST84_9ROSI
MSTYQKADKKGLGDDCSSELVVMGLVVCSSVRILPGRDVEVESFLGSLMGSTFVYRILRTQVFQQQVSRQVEKSGAQGGLGDDCSSELVVMGLVVCSSVRILPGRDVEVESFLGSLMGSTFVYRILRTQVFQQQVSRQVEKSGAQGDVVPPSAAADF